MDNSNKKDGQETLPSKNFNPLEYLDINFICKAYERHYEGEKHHNKRAKIELFLVISLDNGRTKEWLPGYRHGNIYTFDNGKYSFDLSQIADNPHFIFRTAELPMLSSVYGSSFVTTVISYPEFKNSRYVLIRLYGVANQVQKWADISQSNMLPEHCGAAAISTLSPEELLDKADTKATNHLAYHFRISEDINEEISLANSKWSRSINNMTFKIESDEKFIPFIAKNDILGYTVIIKKVLDRTLFLPVSYFVRTDDPKEILLYIMPKEEYPLYNTNLIYKYPDAKIFITDVLDIVLFNESNQDGIFTSFYGGLDTIDKTDFSPLYKREVFWLLLDKCPVCDQKEKYKTALKVLTKADGHGIKFNVVKFSNHSWDVSNKNPDDIVEGKHDGISLLSQKEFLKEAESNGVDIPDSLKENDYGLLDGEELEKLKNEPFMVIPILRRMSYMVLFADTGVGKSWASLSIAIALVHGKSVFPGKWMTDGVQHKVCYFSGEMGKGEIGERVKRLHEVYAGENTNKRNFILKRGTYHNLADPEDQEEFTKLIEHATRHRGTPGLKVSLVVIDNLLTLCTNGECAGNFDKVYRWICMLQEEGIAVILIHHENRKGDINGTSKIINKCDMSVHAIQASINDNVALLLNCEKKRSVKKSDLAPFKAEIDLNASGTGWIVSEPTKAEIAELDKTTGKSSSSGSKKIKKTSKYDAWTSLSLEDKKSAITESRRRGDSNKQMALNLNCCTKTISDFREKYTLRDIDFEGELSQESDI